CIAPSNCPGTDTECQARQCSAGVCGFSFTAGGTPVTQQTAGDCHQNVCNGGGAVVPAVDDTDLPVDSQQCTGDVCNNGAPSNPPQALGFACTQDGGAVCNGTAECVQCNVASTCTGTDTECHTRTCVSGTCGVNNAAAGTPLSAQDAGDCKTAQCDGTGGVVQVAEPTDLPVDGLECTADVCTGSTPSNPPLDAGTVCTSNGGSVCD